MTVAKTRNLPFQRLKNLKPTSPFTAPATSKDTKGFTDLSAGKFKNKAFSDSSLRKRDALLQ